MKCKISSWGCVYHACMSDECQKRFMSKKQFGNGRCEQAKPSTIKANEKEGEKHAILR